MLLHCLRVEKDEHHYFLDTAKGLIRIPLGYPRGATLENLEDVVGRGLDTVVEFPSWLTLERSIPPDPVAEETTRESDLETLLDVTKTEAKLNELVGRLEQLESSMEDLEEWVTRATNYFTRLDTLTSVPHPSSGDCFCKGTTPAQGGIGGPCVDEPVPEALRGDDQERSGDLFWVIHPSHRAVGDDSPGQM